MHHRARCKTEKSRIASYYRRKVPKKLLASIQVFIQTNLLSVVYGTVMEIHLRDLCQKPFMTKRDMI